MKSWLTAKHHVAWFIVGKPDKREVEANKVNIILTGNSFFARIECMEQNQSTHIEKLHVFCTILKNIM